MKMLLKTNLKENFPHRLLQTNPHRSIVNIAIMHCSVLWSSQSHLAAFIIEKLFSYHLNLFFSKRFSSVVGGGQESCQEKLYSRQRRRRKNSDWVTLGRRVLVKFKLRSTADCWWSLCVTTWMRFKFSLQFSPNCSSEGETIFHSICVERKSESECACTRMLTSSCESRHQRGSDCKSLGKYRVTQLIYGTESVSRLQLSFSPPPKCLVIYQVFAARDFATICGMHNANIYKRDILDSVVSVSVSAFCLRPLFANSFTFSMFDCEACACWDNLIASLMRWIKLLILNFFFLLIDIE